MTATGNNPNEEAERGYEPQEQPVAVSGQVAVDDDQDVPDAEEAEPEPLVLLVLENNRFSGFFFGDDLQEDDKWPYRYDQTIKHQPETG